MVFVIVKAIEFFFVHFAIAIAVFWWRVCVFIVHTVVGLYRFCHEF